MSYGDVDGRLQDQLNTISIDPLIFFSFHSKNALELSHFLDAHDKVTRAYYPGLESHPQHEPANAQQSDFGGVLSFEVKEGQEAAG